MRIFRRDQVGTGAEQLAQLDEGRPQLFQCIADPLGDRALGNLLTLAQDAAAAPGGEEAAEPQLLHQKSQAIAGQDLSNVAGAGKFLITLL